MPGEDERIVGFSWDETAERLEEIRRAEDLVIDTGRRSFVALDARGDPTVRFFPPAVQPIPDEAGGPEDYLATLAPSPGSFLVLLVQAGAAAFGTWEDDDLTRHKVIKKYMIRGHGKFQGTYLKTKGKSRYGSRLRLRNTIEFFVEINTRLGEWWEADGPPERAYYSCPTRLWGDLFRSRVPPPFDRDGPWTKIPLDVNVPSFKELRHIGHELLHGKIVRRD